MRSLENVKKNEIGSYPLHAVVCAPRIHVHIGRLTLLTLTTKGCTLVFEREIERRLGITMKPSKGMGAWEGTKGRYRAWMKTITARLTQDENRGGRLGKRGDSV